MKMMYKAGLFLIRHLEQEIFLTSSSRLQQLFLKEQNWTTLKSRSEPMMEMTRL